MNDFNLDFPISFIKKEQRIVVGIATADNLDKTGDIVDFNASLDAFKNWAGNIREMHSPKAVGSAINYEPVKVKGEDGTEYNAIRVEAYISKGAQDTWEKILDGTLKAFSIGGSIEEKSVDTTKIFRGKPVNIIKKYRLGELSLVDNPANALATVDIIKRSTDGNLEYVLEEFINKAKKQRLKDPKGGLTAAGRRHFKETEGANLKPGVKGPADTPEKMRRKGSFLTRFFTNPSGPMKDEKGRPTRLALSAAAWGEPVPQNAQDAAALAAKGRRLLERYAKTKEKSVDDILEDDKDILSKEMEYFLNIDYDELIKEGEGAVTTGSMSAGIKNPTQGYPSKGRKKKVKKEIYMKKEINESSSLVDVLNNALSNTMVLYFSAHRAHWNVEGPDFFEYHALFEEIYEDVYGSADAFAENVRKLGGFPPTMGEMEDDAAFEDDSSFSDAKALASNLYSKNQYLVDCLKNAFMVANNNNEQGIANFLAERIDMHEKWAWQLKSSLLANGVEIPVVSEDEEDAAEDGEMEDEDSSESDLMDLLNSILTRSVSKFEKAAPTKTENGESFPAAAFAYVPDPATPSTWKLRLWETASSKETAAQVGRAVAAIGVGFRGNKVSIPSGDMAAVKAKIIRAWRKTHPEGKTSDMPDILKFETFDVENNETSGELLQNHVQYDTVFNMSEQDVSRLSLIKRLINWLVPDVQEDASTITSVEDFNATQEEEMDIEILKEALSAVVDDKLATFATSIKEEVEAAVQDKIDNLSKSFDAQSTELQEKLDAAEKALAEQEEQVKAFGKSGAVKKSVDPEDDDEDEQIVKSQPTSVWNNVYLPQGIISSLGYKS